MKKLIKKLRLFWYFKIMNPVIRKGEKGGFKWKFRRYWLEIETLSGNFKAKWTADKFPYGYLLAGKEDDNIHGFCETMYMVGALLTTDQGFVDDVSKAIEKYSKRLTRKGAKEGKEEDETEEKIALEEVKQVQEVVEMPKKERREYERKVNKKFKKAAKGHVAQKLQGAEETNK